MKRKPNIAVVGATGVVGSTFLKVLEERDFPFENIYMMASKKSAGKTLTFKGKEYTVEELTEHSFDKPIDIALSPQVDPPVRNSHRSQQPTVLQWLTTAASGEWIRKFLSLFQR